MTSTTWDELGQRKLSYVCRHGIDHWEYCRAIAAHMRWEAQSEQWMIAWFIGTAFILLSVAASILLADRRHRAATFARELRAPGTTKTARRRWSWQLTPSEPALA